MITYMSLARKLFFSAAILSVAVALPQHYVGASEQITRKETLRYGHTGAAVRFLQEELKENGLYPYEIDGIFGAQTEASVRKLQLQTGISVDGMVGQETLTTLTNLTESTEANALPVQVLKDGHLVDGIFLQQALSLIGIPYKWGGTTPTGFDCSGFIKFVFSKKGIHIPRTISEIWEYGIAIDEPNIGDLVFFQTYKPGPSHAGIYLGNGRFIHSGSSSGVTISKLEQKYWSKRYIGSKRIVPAN